MFICSALYSMGGNPSECQKPSARSRKYLDIPVSPIGLNPSSANGGSQNSGGLPVGVSVLQSVELRRPPGGDDLDLVGGMMLGLVP